MTTVPEQIEREVHIAAAPDTVWTAVTEAKHLGTWFGNAGAEVDLRPGGALKLVWRDGDRVDTVHGVVEKVDRPHLFAYRWARPPATEPRTGNSTLVEFTLTADGTGTRLRVVESGFRELEASEQECADHAADNTKGWQLELDELREYVTGAM
jgi:uncharacterized protein YndB with AHSA1/START domain